MIGMFEAVLRDGGYRQYREELLSSLGIAVAVPSNEIAPIVSRGMPAECLATAEHAGVPVAGMAWLFSGNEPLVLSRESSEQLYALCHAYAMANVIFGCAKKASRWMTKSKARFDGKSPVEMIEAGGLAKLEEMLIQIAEGYSF